MKTRKMWAPSDWKNRGVFGVDEMNYGVPVLVTDAEGVPDFGPGDMVAWKTYGFSGPGRVVEGVYINRDGLWCVVFDDGDCDFADGYTRVSTEKTVTFHVTTDEYLSADSLEDHIRRGPGVGRVLRVERVEDDR